LCFKVTEATDFTELQDKEQWLSSSKLVVKPDMLFGKRGKSGLVALNLDLAQVASFVKERLGKEVCFFPLWLRPSFKPYIHCLTLCFLVVLLLNIFLSTIDIF
jgi:succinyl-CoA synthetase beta subunit